MKQFALLFFLIFLTACTRSQSNVWHWSLQGRAYADPLIDGDQLFVVSYAGEIVAGRYSTGEKTWIRNIKTPLVAEPSSSKDLLFVATQHGSIYALEKRNGNQKWTVKLEEQIEAPLSIFNDHLLVPTAAGTLLALSEEDGRLIWEHHGNGKYNARAVVYDHNILIGGWQGLLLCLKEDGSLNWRFQAGNRITEDVFASKNVVYAATHDDSIFAIDIPSGRLLWTYKAPYPSNLLLAGSNLIFGDLHGSLFALNAPTGRLIQKTSVDQVAVKRIFQCQDHYLILTDRLLQFDPRKLSVKNAMIVRPKPFKVACAADRLIVTDEVSGVWGYQRSFLKD
jgi:outer membrane protein assembly factor BamB